MSSTELFEKMGGEEEIVLIDVLSTERYSAEHIPGAVNIPLPALRDRAPKDLRKNQRIVVYGDTHDNEASNEAAQILESMGFRKVSDFDGGIYAWKQAGFRTEGESVLASL